jgi:hypothetical protein
MRALHSPNGEIQVSFLSPVEALLQQLVIISLKADVIERRDL